MTSNMLLVYVQDQGGAKFLSPVVKTLIQVESNPAPSVLVHSISQRLFMEQGIPHVTLEEGIVTPPISVAGWKKFLKRHNVKHVFCTTSSPYVDLSNGNLIQCAKKMAIPTLGVMDHWKGFDRFFRNSRPDFVPDHICCIDEFSRRKFEELGVPADQVHPVGHPYLEKICRERERIVIHDKKEISIILVSQPVTADKSFQSIFFRRTGRNRLIDEISRLAAGFAGGRLDRKICIRQHPKERFMESLPEDIGIDKNREWDQSLKEYDIFIGLDSMALVEAHLAGKICISLVLPEFRGLSDNSIPLPFSRRIDDLSEMPPALEKAIEALRNRAESPHENCAIFLDSTKKVLALLDRFCQGLLNRKAGKEDQRE